MREKGVDIDRRTHSFALRIIKLVEALPAKRRASRILGNQLLRAGTSVAANVEESRGAQNKADFTAKMSIAYKEAREAVLWLKTTPWPDPASQQAEERLKGKGIQLPWHYGDKFGEYFRAVGLKAGGIGVVLLVESSRFSARGLYAAKTLQHFLTKDYLSQPAPVQEKIALAFLEEALPWLEMGQHAGIVSVQFLDKICLEIQRNQTVMTIPFVFSRFMEQGSLKDQLGKIGRLGLKEVLRLGLQLCHGLLHAYSHNLSAHRDLKPDNIMVYQDSIYQITDFSAGVIGTPGYMAPEQMAAYWKNRGVKLASEEIPIDQRADQFALVVILLEALSGRHPFPKAWDACKFQERARKFVEQGVGEVPDGMVPESLRQVMARALSPRPEGRFPDLSAFQGALLALYQAEFGPYQPPEVEIDDSAIWWFDRGHAFYLLGRPASAEVPWKEALGRLRAIPSTEIDQASCLMNLGILYRETQREHEARQAVLEAIEICECYPAGTGRIREVCLKILEKVGK